MRFANLSIINKGLFHFLWTGFGLNVTGLRGVGMALICFFGIFFILYYGIRFIIKLFKRNEEVDPI